MPPPGLPGTQGGLADLGPDRTIRRSAVYASTLPGGCSTVVIEGTSLYSCGGTYYQRSGSQYVVVYVD